MPGQLTDLQKELLRLAEHNDGAIHVLRMRERGDYVRVGDRDYYDSPEQQTDALNAVGKLRDDGLLTFEEGPVHRLTERGHEVARELMES